MRKLVAVLFVVTFLFSAGGSVSNAQTPTSPSEKGWAWAYEPGTASYQPNTDYAYNSSGGGVTIRRSAVGNYAVEFAGLKAPGGSFHVTAFNGNHFCNIGSGGTNPVTLGVLCYSATGEPVDAMFTVLFYSETGVAEGRSGAYVFADKPSEADYVPNKADQWNASGAENRVTRTDVGKYAVSMPNTQLGSTIMLTAMGTAATRCTYWGYQNEKWEVRCFNARGELADSLFALSILKGEALGGAGAYVWSRLPLNADFVFSTTNVTPQASEVSPGVYSVTFDSLKPIGSATAVVTAATVGDNPFYCNIGGWSNGGQSGTTAVVTCFDAAGKPVAAEFTLLYLTN